LHWYFRFSRIIREERVGVVESVLEDFEHTAFLLQLELGQRFMLTAHAQFFVLHIKINAGICARI